MAWLMRKRFEWPLAPAHVILCLSTAAAACEDESRRRGLMADAAAQIDALTHDGSVDGSLDDSADGSVSDTPPPDASCIERSALPEAGLDLPSRVLYTNDFERPNVPLVVDCPHALDSRGINFLYGTAAFQFNQVNTVEGVVIDDPSKLYKNPSGKGGMFALGMLSSAQDDRLSLTFAVTGRPFLNVGFDLSAIDVNGCGGPFGVAAPAMKVSLYESAGAVHSFEAPGRLLDEATVEGAAPSDAYTFDWRYGVASLDASKATTAHVSVVFDLTASGYAAFDNLSIVASPQAGVVDGDNDGLPDDLPLCGGRTLRVCKWNEATMAFDRDCTFEPLRADASTD